MNASLLRRSISFVAKYYNGRKVGHVGHEGYRKSTDLTKLARCMDELLARGLIDPGQTIFADLGCGDGRVNVLLSYFVKRSIGIEIDPEILSEYDRRMQELRLGLARRGLLLPPGNIRLMEGNSLEEATYRRLLQSTGVCFGQIDLFYTYITLHDLFAEKIALEARKGALYLVYGFGKVLPRYRALELLIPNVASEGIVALYRKE